MDYVKILKGGKLVRVDWDAKSKSNKEIEIKDLLSYFCVECKFEDDLKFSDIITLMDLNIGSLYLFIYFRTLFKRLN